MIGILIITHGTLGESLIHCVSHVLNKRPPRVRALGVTAQDDPLLLGRLPPPLKTLVLRWLTLVDVLRNHEVPIELIQPLTQQAC